MSKKTIGLYIHIPFCIKKCNYCDFSSYAGLERYWEDYCNAVANELVIKSDSFRSATVGTIFTGGGTPSLIPCRYIEGILDTVRQYYHVDKNCENTIESNPGTLTSDKLKAYGEVGVNRLSIGLQACQDKILKILGRIHSFNDFKTALNLAQKHGFENINADIIFGIPGQTFEDWQDTVRQVSSFGLTHISCYSLSIEEGTVFGKMKEEGRLEEVDDELDRRMYHYALDKFHEAGFNQYEISNLSKPGYQCRHNMNYWERGEYIGVGAGAHSFHDGRRTANTPDVPQYIKGMAEKKPVLSEDSIISSVEGLAERMILGLRMNQGVDMAQVSDEFGVDVEKQYADKIVSLSEEKLIERRGDIIRLTKLGMDFANLVFIEFI